MKKRELGEMCTRGARRAIYRHSAHDVPSMPVGHVKTAPSITLQTGQGPTDRPSDRQVGRQAGNQTDRQDRQTDRR